MLAPHKGCRSKATAILVDKNIHVQKGDAQAKFWIIVDEIEITEAFSYNFTSANKRQVKKIIYQNFDIIVDAWFNHFVKIKDE